MTTSAFSTSTMTRRSAIRTFAGAGGALIAVAAGGPAVLANHTSQLYTVSTNANFRIGPGTSYGTIAVVRKGDTFTLRGQTQNGYAAISFQGRDGGVLASLVIQAGSAGPTPVISGQAWTIARVNLRSGPSTGHQILRVVPIGAKIGTSTTVQNGFRYVSYDGVTGWMAGTYISFTNPDHQGPNDKTTTANLNLRAEPSTSARILTVIPKGSKVQLLDTGVGQFVNVTYNGLQGWVAQAYLA